jgi:molecular chaperone DnaK (HSP70)
VSFDVRSAGSCRPVAPVSPTRVIDTTSTLAVVIGVPAYFNDAQREATILAAKCAGIDKVKLLREPEAAALAYKKSGSVSETDDDDKDELVLVFDLGGGTYDVSMLIVGGGITEVLCTSGNTQLGGSDFDERIAQSFLKALRGLGGCDTREWSREAHNAVLLAAECVRIHLSNNRQCSLALPITRRLWEEMVSPKQVLLSTPLADDESGSSNSTHLLMTLSRRTMESLCREEFQALLRPIREVAIMAGALLPGDTSPTIVDAALELEDAMNSEYDDFYHAEPSRSSPPVQGELLLAKKSQQQGRKKARDIAKQERKFRTEKRKLSTADLDSVKVRDGISGRPISRVVLVGGATRMPAIGKLLTALTGVTPQKTVNPDEAVALGCAVQAGVLDGMEQFGKVLNPMQAAILRAMAGQAQQFDDD